MVGEVTWYPKTLAAPPGGKVFADGSVLDVADYPALAAVYGATFGGDGTTTFGVPDLRGLTLVGLGGPLSYAAGDTFGTNAVTLSVSELPTHNHAGSVGVKNGDGGSDLPAGKVLSKIADGYDATPDASLGGVSIGATGGMQPHENRQPSFAGHYLIQAV